MNKFLFFFILFCLIAMPDLYSQSNNSIKLKSFIPRTKDYDIYYPENYSVIESEDSIVSISNKESGLSITITSYWFDEAVKENTLIGLLTSFISDYYSKKLSVSDWAVYKSKFDNLIETRFGNKETEWIWWGISHENHVVFISADKEGKITEEELKLIRFMIENLLIN